MLRSVQPPSRALSVVALFARLALGAAFLSAVADRFGLWGAPGTPGVAWGSFDAFAAYTGVLLAFLPTSMITAFAWIATALEVLFAVLLIAGAWTRVAATGSALLLVTFALAMIAALGWKAPLDYSVLSAAAAAALLAVTGSPRWSVDALRR